MQAHLAQSKKTTQNNVIWGNSISKPIIDGNILVKLYFNYSPSLQSPNTSGSGWLCPIISHV